MEGSFGHNTSNYPSDARQQQHAIKYGELAQLGERLVCNQEVTGSSPVFSTVFRALKRARREKLEGFAQSAKSSLTTEYLANGSFSDHTHAVCMD